MTEPDGAAIAAAERDQILDEVKVKHAAAIADGMKVLERWARAGQPFSANDVRAELRAVGLGRWSTGGLFQAAIKAGVLRSVGEVTSNDGPTHAKRIQRYVGASYSRPTEAVTVPVQRNRVGRFSTATPAQEPLFEVSA